MIPRGSKKRLQAADNGDPKSRTVILGNEVVAATDTEPASDDAYSENRANLKAARVNVVDRILAKGTIPHNKSVILTVKGKASAVLTGSTNWTSSGLCTQTNNALVMELPAVADRYMDYWKALKLDVDEANGVKSELQSGKLRDFARANNAKSIKEPLKLDGGVSVQVFFSPSTKSKIQSPPKEHPEDMEYVFSLMQKAQHAILFLAFEPGNNSILDAAGKALAANPKLFVCGALTSTKRAPNFAAALRRGNERTAPMHVAVVGEPGKPKTKDEKEILKPDYRAIPAGSIRKEDAFGEFERELYTYGHAIIHNKIVVIDPFSKDCTVVTGSHNLGYRASHNNDENLVVVRGHRGLAEAYSCHILDLYDHYAWRYWLQQNPALFGRPLVGDDTWQERYIRDADEKSPELRFWLSAAEGK